MKRGDFCSFVIGAIFWYAVLLICILLLCGCGTGKDIQKDSVVDYTEQSKLVGSRLDSILATIRLQYAVTTEKLSNLKIENKTVYLSSPDTLGKQYPTFVSETKAEQNNSESSETNTELQIKLEALEAEISELRNYITVQSKYNENVTTLSFWDKYKSTIVCVGIISFAVLWLAVKRKYP